MATQEDFGSALTRIEAAVRAIIGNFGQFQGLLGLVEQAIPKLHALAQDLENALGQPPPPSA